MHYTVGMALCQCEGDLSNHLDRFVYHGLGIVFQRFLTVFPPLPEWFPQFAYIPGVFLRRTPVPHGYHTLMYYLLGQYFQLPVKPLPVDFRHRLFYSPEYSITTIYMSNVDGSGLSSFPNSAYPMPSFGQVIHELVFVCHDLISRRFSWLAILPAPC